MTAGLNLGLQAYWLEANYPEAFAKVRHIVGLPQYWTWRLTGVATCGFADVVC